MVTFLAALSGLSLLSSLQLAATSTTPTEVLPSDFADPSIIHDPMSGSWYAFATAGNGANVQIANASSPLGPWTLLDGVDLMPSGMGAWAVDTAIWAPDVRYLAASDSFVMYYAGVYAADDRFHCVGAATADSVEGPYQPLDEPLACPTDQGGAIDPSGYWDEASGTLWLLYKVDGNAIGMCLVSFSVFLFFFLSFSLFHYYVPSWDYNHLAPRIPID